MENNPLETSEQKMPTFLRVLSVLSFVYLGFAILGALVNLVSGPLPSDQVEAVLQEYEMLIQQVNDLGSVYWEDQLSKTSNMIRYTNDNHYMNILLLLMSYIFGVVGVIWMLQKRRLGFHFYIIYNLILLLSIYASVPMGEVPSVIIVWNAVISGFFILLYSRNLKWMDQ